MKALFKVATQAVLALFILLPATTLADDFSATREKLRTALEMPQRSAENRARDDNRDPLAAMEFCRLRDTYTVLEFGPAGGWYTEILGPVLQEQGRLLISYKESWMERLDGLLAQEFMSAVEKLPIEVGWNSEARRFDIGEVDYGITDADLALNIREYHNFGPDGAGRVNAATFAALKPGGLYCIIDHTRRHMEPDYSENRRRADPVQVILEVQAAGFELIDWGDTFFKPDDELRYEVGRKTVKGNTDRFSLLFQKPD